MGLTTIGTIPGHFASNAAWVIQVKRKWFDGWQDRSDLFLINVDLSVCEAGVSRCEFFSIYGPGVKLPYEMEIRPRDPADLLGYFVRVIMHDDELGERAIVFSGKVYDEPRMLRGNADAAAGKQQWQAFGPVNSLQRISISRSFWLDNEEKKEIGWLPSLNIRGKQHTLVGNRSKEEQDDGTSYLYGGKEVWNYLHYLIYLLSNFIQQENGPAWTLAGQFEVLASLTASIEWGHTETVYDMIRKLIPREYGLGWMINYTEQGYEIFVYSLLPTDTIFGDMTIPRNPNSVRIQRGNQTDLVEVTVVRSQEHLVDSFRVIGDRIVMCASLAGENAEVENAGELTAKWTPALEQKYIDGAGRPLSDFTDKEHQKARANEKFKDVYQGFIAPINWNYREGILAPKMDADGSFLDEPADFQNSVRSTLGWLPMTDGVDYSTIPATDNNVQDVEPGLQRPIAWVYDSDVAENGGTVGFVETHQNGMSISTMQYELGIWVNATPNHALALGVAFADGSEESDTLEAGDFGPKYDFKTLVATLAWYTDQRIQLAFDVPNELKAGDGSVKEIFVNDAEMWLLAARTVVGVDVNAVLDSGPDMRILRDDRPRLAFIAAGLKARYIEERVRAQAVIKGFKAWADLVGNILELVEEGNGVFDRIGAPITRMEWSLNGHSPVFTIFTGYAGGS